ncbi:MAG: hypothetical protein Ct9H300mP6_05350 [Gammaproteobacteria bacterium]|nr:MAG: hypothetical protein Ct9H300mP6_05350 [Gammaproteobacteria bacterium]
MSEKKEDQNKLIKERRSKLSSLRESGFNFPKPPFPLIVIVLT